MPFAAICFKEMDLDSFRSLIAVYDVKERKDIAQLLTTVFIKQLDFPLGVAFRLTNYVLRRLKC